MKWNIGKKYQTMEKGEWMAIVEKSKKDGKYWGSCYKLIDGDYIKKYALPPNSSASKLRALIEESVAFKEDNPAVVTKHKRESREWTIKSSRVLEPAEMWWNK